MEVNHQALHPRGIAYDALGSSQPQTGAPSLLERISASAGAGLSLPPMLLAYAHPDDEVLALGARLERLGEQSAADQGRSLILTITDGAPLDGSDASHHGFASLDDYRAARREELAAALAHADVPAKILAPAQAFAPIPVPDQTAALHLVELTRALERALRDLQPEAVLTHAYEGGHPDHDACAFAVHTAVRLLGAAPRSGTPADDSTFRAPIIIESPLYRAGPEGSICTGTFLPAPSATETIVRELSPAEQASKRAWLACFPSQAETLAQFSVDRELFRVAPHYDFTQPPHAGQLFYERFPWGMSGERFRGLAAAALHELFRGELAGRPGDARPANV